MRRLLFLTWLMLNAVAADIVFAGIAIYMDVERDIDL